MIEEIIKVLPQSIAIQIETVGASDGITEIRLRVGRRVIVIASNREVILDYIVTLKDLLDILVKVSMNSIYAIQNDINNGFIVIPGGHRIGICGEVVLQEGKIRNIKNINSMNIRIARQLLGCADKLISHIVSGGAFQNTLIVSPPGCGKTTMLRDVIRQVSNGARKYGLPGYNVGLVDERGELASVSQGVSHLDVGMRTDIISNVPKAIGIEMLVRSMGIQVIATDEIGGIEDIEAIRYASLSGVKLVFTMHGSSLEDIARKKGIQSLIQDHYFSSIVILSHVNGPGTIEQVHHIDQEKREVG